MTVERVARTLRVPPMGKPQILSLSLVIAVLALLVFAFSSQLFYVYRENVAIIGARYTPEEVIYNHAKVDSYHVFFLNPERIARRLEALPYVRRASVQVGFPATVRIRVEERSPVLVWARADGFFWVDEDGVVLPVLEERPSLLRLEDPESLALLSEEGALTVAEEEQQTFDPSVLAAILQVRESLPEVRVVYYDSTWGLRIIVPTRVGSVEVILGTLTGLKERLNRLPEILAQVEGQNRRITRIDLTRPDAVFWEQ